MIHSKFQMLYCHFCILFI